MPVNILDNISSVDATQSDFLTYNTKVCTCPLEGAFFMLF